MPTSLLKDSGFELAVGLPADSPHWDEDSTNFVSPTCNPEACGSGPGSEPRTGVAWVFFSPGEIAETATVSQELVFPLGAAVQLEFYLDISFVESPFTDTLLVQIDGGTELTISEPVAPFPGYTFYSVDLDEYADGELHELTFRFTSTDVVGFSAFNVDDVKLVFDQKVYFLDGGFEAVAGTPPVSPFWDESSTTFGSPLCTTDWCVDAGLTLPRTGDAWNWFGGNGTGAETANINQFVILPRGAWIDLKQYLWIGRVTAPFTDTMTISLDGGVLVNVVEPASATGGYAPSTIILDAFADGNFHNVDYNYQQPASGGKANFNLDDLSITEVGCYGLFYDDFESLDTSNWSAALP